MSGEPKFNALLLQCSLKNENKDKYLLLNISKVQIGVNNVNNAHSNSDSATQGTRQQQTGYLC